MRHLMREPSFICGYRGTCTQPLNNLLYNFGTLRLFSQTPLLPENMQYSGISTKQSISRRIFKWRTHFFYSKFVGIPLYPVDETGVKHSLIPRKNNGLFNIIGNDSQEIPSNTRKYPIVYQKITNAVLSNIRINSSKTGQLS